MVRWCRVLFLLGLDKKAVFKLKMSRENTFFKFFLSELNFTVFSKIYGGRSLLRPLGSATGLT